MKAIEQKSLWRALNKEIFEYNLNLKLKVLSVKNIKLKNIQIVSTADELDILLEFTNKLLNNSKPLDSDIAKLVNDNIMDLLA